MPATDLTVSPLVLPAPVSGSPEASFWSPLQVDNFLLPVPRLARPHITQFYPWDLKVNWQNGVTEEIAFRTEVIVSRNGKEQRRAQRVNPRYSYRWGIRVAHSAAARLERLLAKRQAFNFKFQHPRATVLAGRGHPAAAGFIGRFDRDVSVTARSDRILDLDLSVMANPGVYAGDMDFPNPYPPAAVTYRGAEVFALRPNWAEPVKLTFGQKAELFDFQRGVTDFYTPEAFTTRIIQCGYMIRNRAQEEALLGLWYRCRGQQREFYMVDPLTAQVVPTSGIAAGADTITVPGPDMHIRFNDEAIYRNLAFRTKTGMIYRGVADIELVGGNSRILLSSPLPAIPLTNLVGIHWLLRCRFGVDTLSIRWVTATIGRLTLTIRALEEIE